MFRSLAHATACAVVMLIVAASAAAAPTWLPAETLTPNGSDAGNYPDIASDAAGDVIAVWDRSDGSTSFIEAAVRPAGGSFAVVPISDSQGASDAQIAMNPSGEAIVVWSDYDGSDTRIKAAIRPPGGSFGSPVTLSDVNASDARVAIAASGEAVAAWRRYDGSHYVIEATVRPAGGAFGGAKRVSPDTDDSSAADVAMNDAGLTAVGWVLSDNTNTGHILFQTVLRASGASFPDSPNPDTISPLTDDADNPQVGVDAAGNTTAIWRDSGATTTTEAKVRPAGQDWPSDSDTIGDGVSDHQMLAVNGNGAAIAAWAEEHSPNYLIKAATRPAGGSFGGATTLSPLTGQFERPDVAINSSGDIAVVWRQYDPVAATSARVMPAGGSFGDTKTLTADNVGNTNYHAVTVDPLGNAAAVWIEADDDGVFSYRVHAAGFDASPPALSNVSIPDIGTTGSALLFSASASDIWSPVTTGWSFTDGGAGTGGSVSHVFAAPGAYAATVTATDGVGNSTSQSKQLTISTPAQTVNPAPSANPDLTAPAISGLAVKPSKFRKRAKIAYSLSEAAKVTFKVERVLPGRKVGRRCTAPNRKNRGRKRCTRYVAMRGSLSQNGKAGANTLTLNRRFGGRSLPAGSYRLTVRATDAAGNASVKRAGFKIMR